MLAYDWKPIKIDGKPGASLQCADCKRWCTLGGEIDTVLDAGGHTIDSDGNVSPSVVCPFDGCEWHQSVTLVGWPEGPPQI